MKTLVIAAALVLTGCVPSIEPLYTAKDVIYDAHFTGNWAIKDATLAITAGDDNKSYKVAYDAKEDKAVHLKFTAHLMKLGSSMFADLFPDMPEQMMCYPCVPMHMFAKVAVNENTLKIDLFDTGWLDTMAKAGKLQTASALIDDMRILTAKTPDLQALMLKHENDSDAFMKGDPWTKSR